MVLLMSLNFVPHVLIVDDEEPVRTVLSRILKRRGFMVETSCGVDEALNLMKGIGVDIVLTDHQMEGKTGLDLIVEVTDRYPDIEKILLTGFGDKELYRDIINKGTVYSILEKPVESAVLIETVERALEHRTKRIEELEEYANLRARYHDIFAHTTDLILCVDTQGSFIYVNPAWHKALGYSETRIHGMKVTDIVKEDSRESFIKCIENIHMGNNEGIFDTTFVARDGRDVFLEGTGTVQQNVEENATVTFILRDVTERRRASEQLNNRLREETMIAGIASALATSLEPKIVYEDILEMIGNTVYATGAYIFAINEVDNVLERVAKWPLEKIGKEELFETISTSEFSLEVWKQALETELVLDSTQSFSESLMRYYEDQPFFAILSIPIKISSCTVGLLTISGSEKNNYWHDNDISMLKAATDIIANAWTRQIEIDFRKEKEREAEESQLMVIRADRLAALGTMAAGIIHEITQPLNAINISAQTIMYGASKGWTLDSDKVTSSLNLITEQIQRMNAIITNMRAFARDGREIPRQKENMNVQVDRVMSMLGEQMKAHNIEVVRNNGDIPDITVNTQQILQVITNLVTNARQAVDDNDCSDRRIIITTSATDTDVFLEVADSGPGVSNDILENIFDPFFTTKEVGKGTGLGLSISLGIINDHKGSLDVGKSDMGGAVFTVRIPRDNCSQE